MQWTGIQMGDAHQEERWEYNHTTAAGKAPATCGGWEYLSAEWKGTSRLETWTSGNDMVRVKWCGSAPRAPQSA
eukprot:3956148-Prymnesium_polylepis.1